MALTTTISANEILNRVAAEVGISPVVDPYASSDVSFIKMRYLLDTAGEELMQAHTWEFLNKSHSILTAAGDSGSYDLPADFGYMLNQTGWERSENVPLGGPLSPQDWAYLKGRDLAQNTLYASFRISEGAFKLYPEPPPVNLDVNFEYVSTYWVQDGVDPTIFKAGVTTGTDIPMYDKTLITRYLKLKYLEATGFDSTAARDDFTQCFSFLTGKDKAAGVLNAGSSRRAYPYLTTANLPDTGFGL